MGRTLTRALLASALLTVWVPALAGDAPGNLSPPVARPLDESSPHWGGFTSALERYVRVAIARAADANRRITVTKPHAAPLAAPGGVGRGAAGPGVDPEAVEGTESLPTHLWLGAAVPNPSAGEVKFRLDLPAPAVVRLVIIDVAGRSVSESMERRAAGRHTIAWDGGDRRGQLLHSGVYFARLEVDGQPIGTRRIAVIR